MTSMKEYISIIIPCYNTEKYLEKCLQSILNQSFKNYEIILIEDSSTDKTKEIIEEYVKKHSNIKAIYNEENKGAAYSRNKALKEASYDLISFIDSDDVLDSNFYEEMLSQMKKEKTDLVVCDIYLKFENKKGTDTRCVACLDPSDKYSFMDNGHAASPCNKIFQKSILLKYPFPEGIMNEDIATVLPILYTTNNISYNKNTCYYYIQREESVQNSHLSEKRLDLFKSLDILEKRVPRKETNEKFWNIVIFNQIITFLIYYITQEENTSLRRQYLKKFNVLSKKYSISKNPILEEFYKKQGTKHRTYYKSLISLTTKGCYLLANSIISFYHFYSKKIKKSVIEKEITMDKIINLAKKQNSLEASNIKLSVVIPNYNYEKYLLERLYSILSQKEKITEIIILDDCSKDNSRELIDKIEKNISKYIRIKKCYNKENSGTAFKQWEKGFSLTEGDYVWIAEADDYSKPNFLKEVLKPIKEDKDIVLSYADTALMDQDGYIIMNSIKTEIDFLKTGHWNKDYINDGRKEIEEYAYLNCTIANVSSVIFKKEDYHDFFQESSKFKQAGDWLFYLYIMTTGKVAFSSKVLNYYRLHGNNVTSLTKNENHLKEIQEVHHKIDQMIPLKESQRNNIQKRYEYLKDVWKINN